ncbi:hypothetical protein DFH08DRAFT_823512 [Mycena albidolilacea]|uniref:Secreted protein n=1 Tax=Mycena albidolilacea TaxID=1033008 RepID=A0AAD7EBJ3_9AGAR|nr:hypothetical protein DFH08DRAFT_823512 [Mycena albidolilacea]
MLVNDSHFVLLLPFSLVLPAAPVIDAGSTQSPTPAPTTPNVCGTQPVLYGSAELLLTSSPRPAHSAHHSSCAEKGTMPRRGAHKRWRLAGASRWNASDVDLGVLETHAIFLGRAGGRHEGAHWVHMCAAAQLHELARQYE